MHGLSPRCCPLMVAAAIVLAGSACASTQNPPPFVLTGPPPQRQAFRPKGMTVQFDRRIVDRPAHLRLSPQRL
jgi:hypothetical protein